MALSISVDIMVIDMTAPRWIVKNRPSQAYSTSVSIANICSFPSSLWTSGKPLEAKCLLINVSRRPGFVWLRPPMPKPGTVAGRAILSTICGSRSPSERQLIYVTVTLRLMVRNLCAFVRWRERE